jgi:hypothetical protein
MAKEIIAPNKNVQDQDARLSKGFKKEQNRGAKAKTKSDFNRNVRNLTPNDFRRIQEDEDDVELQY